MDNGPSLFAPDAEYAFGPEFRRKLLAAACRTDLLHLAPGCFQARFFGARGEAGRRPSGPQRIIAQCIESVWEAGEGVRERPSFETVSELLRRQVVSLPPEVRGLVQAEWDAVRQTEVPDPIYAANILREWAQDEALAHAVRRSHEILQAGAGRPRGDRGEIRKLIDAALAVGGVASGGVGYYGDMAARALRWARGDDLRGKVPTGFGRLDEVLDGGTGRGEVFYWLAPPKSGKTHALVSCAMTASGEGMGVAFFSYEMKLEAMLRRMDRHVASASKRALRAAPERLLHAGRGWRSLGAAEVWVEQFQAKRHGCEEAARVVERVRHEGQRIDLVVLDYLNIMSGQRGVQEKRHELSAISREMSALAKELDVPVWSAALVNRAAVDKPVVRANDIAEAFEVISVIDGGVAICATKEERSLRPPQCRFFLAVLREDESEMICGTYERLADRMRFREVRDE